MMALGVLMLDFKGSEAFPQGALFFADGWGRVGPAEKPERQGLES